MLSLTNHSQSRGKVGGLSLTTASGSSLTQSNEPGFEKDLEGRLEEGLRQAWEEDNFTDLLDLIQGTGCNFVNWQSRKGGLSAAMAASGSDCILVGRLILALVFSADGTLFLSGSAWGRDEELEELLSMGANPELRCSLGKTAMDYAKEGKKVGMRTYSAYPSPLYFPICWLILSHCPL